MYWLAHLFKLVVILILIRDKSDMRSCFKVWISVDVICVWNHNCMCRFQMEMMVANVDNVHIIHIAATVADSTFSLLCQATVAPSYALFYMLPFISTNIIMDNSYYPHPETNMLVVVQHLKDFFCFFLIKVHFYLMLI